MLGDNILEDDIGNAVKDFDKQDKGAKIFLKQVKNPKSFGVAEVRGDKIIGIEEKPKNPKTHLAVIGVYMFDSEVWKIIKTLKPSSRNELEITDVNNYYVSQGTMTYQILQGWWGDGGESFDSLLEAANLVFQKENNKK